ncbi:MAG: UDP-glucose 6-dehydrogenase, partial [Actinomycetota bacterium]|nr:UDP-glucose 6-dehydrogenase [Actinomycetota bacterium]
MRTRIAVIGCGYVGLTTGACLAHLGHRVVCADIDRERVAMLRRGRSPILERGLDHLVREGIDGGTLSFVTSARGAVRDADFVYL